MADVSTIPDGTATTAAQIEAIIAQIDLNIYNILNSSKHAAAPHGEFGAVGYKHEPDKGLAAMRAMRAEYVAMLNDIPAEIHSQWNNPAF